MYAAVLTISTSVAAGATEDHSGPALVAALEAAGATVTHTQAVPDDREQIAAALHELSRGPEAVDLVFTTGGTGLTPDDITPEATRAVIDREAPGFAEAMRAEALRRTPMGILTRGISGIAGRTLIVNFPGSPKAIDELFDVIAPTLAHAASLLRREGGSRGSH